MSNARKAAPREKQVEFQPERYRVTGNPHFINGNLEPVGAIVRLPVGVKPGKKLELVEEPKPEKPEKAEKSAADKAAK